MVLAGRFLLGVSVALLLHAGFSAVHFKSTVNERYGDVNTPLPVDVVVEALVALLAGLAGGLLALDKFKPIHSSGSAPTNSLHSVLGSRPDFAPLPTGTPVR